MTIWSSRAKGKTQMKNIHSKCSMSFLTGRSPLATAPDQESIRPSSFKEIPDQISLRESVRNDTFYIWLAPLIFDICTLTFNCFLSRVVVHKKKYQKTPFLCLDFSSFFLSHFFSLRGFCFLPIPLQPRTKTGMIVSP